jgi:curved DNA-binding protein CbpA
MNPYLVLGVEPTATDEQIKKAYRALARELHPDRNGGDATKTQRFKAVTAAYEILGDPVKRAAHDKAGSKSNPDWNAAMWETIRNAASSVGAAVRESVQAQDARDLATETVEYASRYSKGKFRVGMAIDEDTFDVLGETLNELQKRAFANEIGKMIESLVYAELTETLEEEEEDA